MKALRLLATTLILITPAFAEGTGSVETTGKSFAPRKTARASRASGSGAVIRVADKQSEVNAAWFAASKLTGAIIEYTGLYLTVGGGYARMNAGDFTQTTSYNEVLHTTDTVDGVAFGRIELCYQFDENWDIALAATRYGTAEVQIAFPKYPGIMSILPLPDYKRHVMLYRTTRYSLMPTYSYEAGDRLRFRCGLGLMCNTTKSHIDATYYAWFSGRPNAMISESYPEVSRTDWSGIVSFGTEYAIFKHASLTLSLAYAPYKIKVAAERSALGFGASTPSPGTVRVDALEAALSFNLRR